MSLFRRQTRWAGQTAEQLIPPRSPAGHSRAVVNTETAMRHSAVWACLRLRANLISTMPQDAYRKVGGIQVEVPKPPVLVNPGGERVGMLEWMYSTQMDLDRAGNTFGLITARSANGLPARIDLVPVSAVSVRVKDGDLIGYRVDGKVFDPSEVWHEKQYTVAGLHVGLSPIAYAAWSIGEYLSIQEFALDWFGNGAIPAATLKNTQKAITREQAETVKERFKAAVAGRDIFVTGADWEYAPIQAEAQGAEWVNAKQFGVGDVARFFDCPGDLIDAAVSGQSVTYANIGQRNLQLLIMHLGPAIVRREDALSGLLARPRFVKLNSDALLRMDPQTRASVIAQRVESRTLTPNEARALENLPPFTPDQLAEFDLLFGAPRTNPTPATTGVSP